MSYININKFGSIDVSYNVFGKDKLQERSLTEEKLMLLAITGRIKVMQSEIIFMENNFDNFEKESIMNGIEEMRKTNNSLKWSFESSVKSLEMSLKNTIRIQ